VSTKHKYYPKRQIINMSIVPEEQFEERIILCLPHFAWRVARAYLSQQAQWESTYAVEFFDSHYVSPDEETMEKIKASLDAALAEDDMSCDLEQAISDLSNDLVSEMGDNNESLVNAILQLVAKECGVGCGGSGGSGATEAPPSEFEDDGETPPADFPTYSAYQAWKCGVAKLIFDQITSDLEYIKGIAVTEITATLLGAVLLTPIPLDDIGVLVGAIIAWGVEDIVDTLIDEVLADLSLDEDNFLCLLYEALSVPGAEDAIDNWADTNLSGLAGFLLGFFVNNDNLNRLFEESNQILPSNDCSGCGLCQTAFIAYGTGTVGEGTATIDYETISGIRSVCAIYFDRVEGTPSEICGDGVTVTGVTIDYGTPNRYYLEDDEGTIIHDSSTPPSWPQYNVTYLYVSHGDAVHNPLGITVGWSV